MKCEASHFQNSAAGLEYRCFEFLTMEQGLEKAASSLGKSSDHQ